MTCSAPPPAHADHDMGPAHVSLEMTTACSVARQRGGGGHCDRGRLGTQEYQHLLLLELNTGSRQQSQSHRALSNTTPRLLVTAYTPVYEAAGFALAHSG